MNPIVLILDHILQVPHIIVFVVTLSAVLAIPGNFKKKMVTHNISGTTIGHIIHFFLLQTSINNLLKIYILFESSSRGMSPKKNAGHKCRPVSGTVHCVLCCCHSKVEVFVTLK